MFHKIHGVRAIIHNNDNKILILKRSSKDKYDPDSWDLPGGKIELGESVNEAIKREVLEETGLELSAISIKDLYGFICDDFDKPNKLIIAVFICESSLTNIKLSPEHSEYQWISTQNNSSYKLSRILKDMDLLF